LKQHLYLNLEAFPLRFAAMSTVLEIEQALEQLPTKELLEVAGWLEDRTTMIMASESMFQMLDDEETQNSGSQWLGE